VGDGKDLVMTFQECKFELAELRCADCGKRTGNQGTCEDVDLCADCRAGYDEANGPGTSAQVITRLIEGHKYIPKPRAVHLRGGGRTLCGLSGNHNTTAEVEDVTCKRCRARHRPSASPEFNKENL
jgi:hypothetical protein